MGVDLSKFFRRSDEPGNGVFSITPSNTVVFDNKDTNPPMPNAIWVGTGGDLAVVMRDGSSAIVKNASSGTNLVGNFKQVLATGTTASNLLGWY